MDLDDVKAKAAALSPWAHLATVRALYLGAYGMAGTDRWSA